MKLEGIDKALKAGCVLHAFRSGGGLRVIRIEKDGQLRGYGEHPQAEDALSHANEDFLVGHRPYEEVYGDKGTEPRYLSGDSTSTGPLDRWLYGGNTFDVWQDDDDVVFKLEGFGRVEPPEDIVDKVRKTGNPETWKRRGYTYRIHRITDSLFFDSKPTVVVYVIDSPKGVKNSSDSWIYRIDKTGRGKDFWEAAQNAFEAEEAEIEQR